MAPVPDPSSVRHGEHTSVPIERGRQPLPRTRRRALPYSKEFRPTAQGWPRSDLPLGSSPCVHQNPEGVPPENHLTIEPIFRGRAARGKAGPVPIDRRPLLGMAPMPKPLTTKQQAFLGALPDLRHRPDRRRQVRRLPRTPLQRPPGLQKPTARPSPPSRRSTRSARRTGPDDHPESGRPGTSLLRPQARRLQTQVLRQAPHLPSRSEPPREVPPPQSPRKRPHLTMGRISGRPEQPEPVLSR